MLKKMFCLYELFCANRKLTWNPWEVRALKLRFIAFCNSFFIFKTFNSYEKKWFCYKRLKMQWFSLSSLPEARHFKLRQKSTALLLLLYFIKSYLFFIYGMTLVNHWNLQKTFIYRTFASFKKYIPLNLSFSRKI